MTSNPGDVSGDAGVVREEGVPGAARSNTSARTLRVAGDADDDVLLLTVGAVADEGGRSTRITAADRVQRWGPHTIAPQPKEDASSISSRLLERNATREFRCF